MKDLLIPIMLIFSGMLLLTRQIVKAHSSKKSMSPEWRESELHRHEKRQKVKENTL